MKCRTCQTECLRRISRSAKNRGREYWACPDKCPGWNGWVEPDDSKVAKVVKGCCLSCGQQCNTAMSQSEKNKGRYYWSCPARCDIFNGWVSQDETPAPESLTYTCKRCQHVLDMALEVENNRKRYVQDGVPHYMIQERLQMEVKDAMRDNDYTCEACLLGNETTTVSEPVQPTKKRKRELMESP